MLPASVDPNSDTKPIAAAFGTKNFDEITWQYVKTTLIIEFNARKKTSTNFNNLKNKRCKIHKAFIN